MLDRITNTDFFDFLFVLLSIPAIPNGGGQGVQTFSINLYIDAIDGVTVACTTATTNPTTSEYLALEAQLISRVSFGVLN